mmetsp:Transcript_788/g.2241  ORF Transcript_788/g.2241 Transcript_788/m.2241 type:complete len:258 (-) Transcript_788:182-955(-)
MKPLTLPTSARLFATGATVGPVVDSFHNQCLLTYGIAPISLAWPASDQALLPLLSSSSGGSEYFFCSSWTVPPLLGIAYVVLGGVLPRVFHALIGNDASDARPNLRNRAILAVATTAMIIKLSEFLTVTDGALAQQPHLAIMLAAALAQWAALDGTLVALLVASITSIGGPLSELPFVANGFWQYLDSAKDYLPLLQLDGDIAILKTVLGDDYRSLGLSSITGPCYFAVTMDAIALGRWFDGFSEGGDVDDGVGLGR